MPEIEIPEIREIAPPLPPDASWPIYVWILIAFAALALITLAIILWRNRSTPPPAAIAYDARQSALTKLHELKENYLQVPANEFALGASHGLREYLTCFYGGMTPFETGREFLARQDDHGLMSEQKVAAVRDLYQRSEELKYAHAPGADSRRLDLVNDIIAFVRDDVPGRQLQAATANHPDSDSSSDADPLPA